MIVIALRSLFIFSAIFIYSLSVLNIVNQYFQKEFKLYMDKEEQQQQPTIQTSKPAVNMDDDAVVKQLDNPHFSVPDNFQEENPSGELSEEWWAEYWSKKPNQSDSDQIDIESSCPAKKISDDCG